MIRGGVGVIKRAGRKESSGSKPPTVLSQIWLVGDVQIFYANNDNIIIVFAPSHVENHNNPYEQMDIYE